MLIMPATENSKTLTKYAKNFTDITNEAYFELIERIRDTGCEKMGLTLFDYWEVAG